MHSLGGHLTRCSVVGLQTGMGLKSSTSAVRYGYLQCMLSAFHGESRHLAAYFTHSKAKLDYVVKVSKQFGVRFKCNMRAVVLEWLFVTMWLGGLKVRAGGHTYRAHNSV